MRAAERTMWCGMLYKGSSFYFNTLNIITTAMYFVLLSGHNTNLSISLRLINHASDTCISCFGLLADKTHQSPQTLATLDIIGYRALFPIVLCLFERSKFTAYQSWALLNVDGCNHQIKKEWFIIRCCTVKSQSTIVVNIGKLKFKHSCKCSYLAYHQQNANDLDSYFNMKNRQYLNG